SSKAFTITVPTLAAPGGIRVGCRPFGSRLCHLAIGDPPIGRVGATLPVGEVRVVGVAIAGPLVVGARDHALWQVLEIPNAVVALAAAVLVRLLRERRRYREMRTLDDHLIPRVG